MASSKRTTPLHCAIWHGMTTAAISIVANNTDIVNSRDSDENTPLHIACYKGDLECAKLLISKKSAHQYALNITGDTPLHCAALSGHLGVIQMLVEEIGCDPNIKSHNGRTLVHSASLKGHFDVVNMLMRKLSLTVDSIDKNGKTPLHLACEFGRTEVVKALISEHGAEVNAHDFQNSTPLHCAAVGGQSDTIKMLVQELGCDPNVRGFKGRTLLHEVCRKGHLPLVNICVQDLSLAVNSEDEERRTPLHLACALGHTEVAKTLISEHGANMNARDFQNSTPLYRAAVGGQSDTIRMLVQELGCDPNVRGFNGRTLLHTACGKGHLPSVNMCVQDFSLAVNSEDEERRTPLHLACVFGHNKVAKALISRHGADVNARDFQNDTPLHRAAVGGQSDIIQMLVQEFGCDPNVRGFNGRTLLHAACGKGHLHVVKILSEQYPYLLFLVDNDGNTGLHLASMFGHINLVKYLLAHYKTPVFNHNKNGNSAMDVAANFEIKAVFQSYFTEHQTLIAQDYVRLQSLSKQRFLQCSVTRIFVVGHPGSGKSTLVEALKTESWFSSLIDQRLTESIVPPHTAGIVPSLHRSSKYGTVFFYDFAGDAEYYSSHAAVLERMMMGSGRNIFLLVTDLSKNNESVKDEVIFWLSFISFHSKSPANPSRVFVIGSHTDVVKSSGESPQAILHNIEELASTICNSMDTLSLDCSLSVDCCRPKSVKLEKLPEKLSLLHKQTLLHNFSAGASILIGLIERDFKEVITCPINRIIEHIIATGVHLPANVSDLVIFLLELQNYGFLLIAGKIAEPENLWIILNVSELTQEIHRKLFSRGALEYLSKQNDSKIQTMLKLGIVPETTLHEICPLYMTKECLIQLQYCQEIPQADIYQNDLIETSSLDISESEYIPSSLLFFPALLQLRKESIEWAVKEKISCSLGWYGTCYRQFDYLPPRFVHVLLLRLAFCAELISHQTKSFTSCSRDNTDGERPELRADCHIWKWGIRMSTELGVEFLVEVVNKGVVIVCRSVKDNEVHCCSVFSSIIEKVLEAKAEFCYNIILKSYLLDPDELSQTPLSSLDVSQLHKYAMSDVKRVLINDKPTVRSSDEYGSKMLSVRKLHYFKEYTMWNLLFPLKLLDVLHSVRAVADCDSLGLELGLSLETLRDIKVDYPTRVEMRRREVIQQWMSSPTLQPSWYFLVKALENIDMSTAAEEIAEERNVSLQLQLINDKNSDVPITEDFMREFSAVVGERWPSLASLLGFNFINIESIKKIHVVSSPSEQALHMLWEWRRKEKGTYRKLRDRLRTIPLLETD